MTHPFMETVATGLYARGVATLRYQFPYMEAGSKRPDSPAVAHAAVRAAVAEAARQCPGLPLIAGGKSFGGRMTSQAQATAPLAGECARCLRPLTTSVTASFTELYLYADGRRTHDKHEKHDKYDKHAKHAKHDRHNSREWFDEDTEQDDEERFLDGDLLDLEPVLRDAVVLALPMSPLCREECPGLCVECGVPLDDAGPGHGHDDSPDPRWAALEQLGDQPARRSGAVDLQEG